MKARYIIFSITSLACTVGLKCLSINPANAANLSFSYTFDSSETISGSFVGDLVPGTTEYTNLSKLSAIYSGAPGVIFESVDVGSSFNSNSSEFFSFVGRQSSAPENVFTITGGNNTDFQVVIPTQGILDADATIVDSRFEVNGDDGVTIIPEPGITVALITLGSLGCLQKLKKN